MKTISEITGKTYEAESMVFFRNAKQAAHYKEWGAELIDLFVDSKMTWVFVFSKEDHLKYRDRWMNNKTEQAVSV